MEFWNHILNQSVMPQFEWIFWCGHTTSAGPRKLCVQSSGVDMPPFRKRWTRHVF